MQARIELQTSRSQIYQHTYPFADSVVLDANFIAISSCLGKEVFHSTELRLEQLIFFLQQQFF